MSVATQHQGNVTGKKSFGQTVFQSARVMGGANVPNYSLYFLNPTKRNRAGEHETIVIPYIEIGRGAGCAVQYGDEYPTVGRKHAAIRFDQGKIVLKQLHSTNPTIITQADGTVQQLTMEGQEAPLENGFQIQFSYNGPVIRMNATPTATSKMGVTQRVQLALKQGIRPYRQAVAGLAIALVALGVGGGYVTKILMDDNKDLAAHVDYLENTAVEKEKEYKQMIAQGKLENDAAVRRARREAELARREAEDAKKLVQSSNSSEVNDGPIRPVGEINVSQLSKFKPSIYYIFPKSVSVRHPEFTNNQVIDVTKDLYEKNITWSGTAFLTDENKLITARHVITPWRFPESCNDVFTVISQCELGGSVDAVYSIIAPGGKEIESFTLSEVRMSATDDERLDDACPGLQLMRCPDRAMYTDWAWVNMAIKGNIKLGRKLSTQLLSGTNLGIYGYSKGLALQDLTRVGLDPLYGPCTVAQDGLNGKIIRVSDKSFSQGASGGPVFAESGGQYYAIGIISHGIDNIGGIVPVSHLK